MSMAESGAPSLVGAYVVLRVNARAMVAGYVDSPILAVARALGTQRYVALVEKEVQIPASPDARGWRAYRVSFVGRHTQLGRSPCRNDCIPIFPAPSHSKTSVPVRASPPFPFSDYCHRPSMEAFVRVLHQPYFLDQTPLWTLSGDQCSRIVSARKLASSSSMSSANADPHTYLPSVTSDATSLTFRSPAASPRAEADFAFARMGPDRSGTASPTLSALADLALAPVPSGTPSSQDFSVNGPRPPRITTPASDITSSRTETSAPPSALFDSDRGRPKTRRGETMDSMSVYSTTSSASSIALNLESPSTSKLVLGTEVDWDEVPLVDLWCDLEELDPEAVPDPRGFSEERDVVMQLVQKAKQRDASSRMLTPEPRPDSQPEREGSERRLSLSASMIRVRSRQSTNTVPSMAASIPRSPNKLRRVKSHHSAHTRMDEFGVPLTPTRSRPSKLHKRASTKSGLRVGPHPGEESEATGKRADIKTYAGRSGSASVVALGSEALPKRRDTELFSRLSRFLRTLTARVAQRLGLKKRKQKTRKTTRSVRGGSRSPSRESVRIPKP